MHLQNCLEHHFNSWKDNDVKLQYIIWLTSVVVFYSIPLAEKLRLHLPNYKSYLNFSTTTVAAASSSTSSISCMGTDPSSSAVTRSLTNNTVNNPWNGLVIHASERNFDSIINITSLRIYCRKVEQHQQTNKELHHLVVSKYLWFTSSEKINSWNYGSWLHAISKSNW